MCPFINVYVALVTNSLGKFWNFLLCAHANRAALLPRAPFAAVRLLVLLCLPLRAVLRAHLPLRDHVAARPWSNGTSAGLRSWTRTWSGAPRPSCESYTPKKYAFRNSGSGRLVASTHLAAPAPQTIDRGDAAETENVVVSVKT